MSPGSAAPESTPKNTFSIFLYSIPVHCETNEIPFLKCHKLVPRGMAQNWRLISASPSSKHFIAHFMTWSLKTPLCSWCRRSGVMQPKMSQWGRSSQNGLFGCNLWHVNSSVLTPAAASAITSNTLSMLHRTVSSGRPILSQAATHLGHQFSWLHVTKHCSGWSAT